MTFNPARTRSRLSWRVVGFFCIALLCVTLALAGQTGNSQKRPKRKSPPAAPPPEIPAVVPFHAGEKLAFRALWSKYSVTAGSADISVVERRDFFGRPAWHFQVLAHSLDTMRILYELDDQFDSYTDAVKLNSLQYEMYLHEQGKQQSNVYRMSSTGDPAPPNAAAARVPPDTRDPVGVLFALRAVDWKSQAEFRVPVYDGRNFYEIVAQTDLPAGQVTVPAGQFTASRINVKVFEHGEEVSGTHCALWLADDAARTPVLIEAEVPVGSVRIELTSR